LHAHRQAHRVTYYGWEHIIELKRKLVFIDAVLD